MSFDGLFIYYLIKELNSNLQKARLERIFFDGEKRFYLNFYNMGSKNTLTIDLNSSSSSVYITKRAVNENVTSNFLKIFKKEFEGAILKNIDQYLTDRVIIFTFFYNDIIFGMTEKKLIFEAFGKDSNLYCIKNDIIIDCFKKDLTKSNRTLIPKAKYSFLSQNKKSLFTISCPIKLSQKEIIETYMGVSPLLASYLISNNSDLLQIAIKPTLNFETNAFYLFDLFAEKINKKYFHSLSELLDNKNIPNESFCLNEKKFISDRLQKLVKKQTILSTVLNKTTKDFIFKEYADYIYSSQSDLKEKRSCLDHVPLNILKTLNENAQDYYKKYQKAKRTTFNTQIQIANNNDLIALFQLFSEQVLLLDKNSIKDFVLELQKYGYRSFKKELIQNKPKIIVSKLNILGRELFVGKNNFQNEYLITTIAHKNDYWFHIKDGSGSHVVLIGVELNEEIIRAAAMIAAFYSSYKESSSIAVDYTQVKNIKKIPGKPGYFVTYKDYKTIFIDIDLKILKTLLN